MNTVYLCSIEKVPWIDSAETLVLYLFGPDWAPQSLIDPTVIDTEGVEVLEGVWLLRHAARPHGIAYYVRDPAGRRL
jgi:hypothetical protein